MASFLICYNRLTGVRTIRRFDVAEEAMAARMVEESRVGPDIEVVVVAAESEDDLRRTHRRYFSSAHEMLAEAAASMAEDAD